MSHKFAHVRKPLIENEHTRLRRTRLEFYIARANYLAAIRQAEQAILREARELPEADILEFPSRMQAG